MANGQTQTNWFADEPVQITNPEFMQNPPPDPAQDPVLQANIQQMSPASAQAPGQLQIDTTGQSGMAGPGAGRQNPWWQLPFDAPDRYQTIDPNTGMLKGQYQLDVNQRRPQSALLAQQLKRQRLEEAGLADVAQRQGVGAMATGMGRLSTTGALSGGAAANLARSGQRDILKTQQGIRRGGMEQRAGLREQDIARQIRADQYNIGQSLDEIQKGYQGDLQKFDILSKAYGADRMANAIEQGGPQGGLAGALGPFGQILQAPGNVWNTIAGVG